MNNGYEFKLPPYKITKVVPSLSQNMDWGLTRLNIPELWEKSRGENVTVMVIDTGLPGIKDIDGEIKIHPDIKHNIDFERSRSFVPGEDVFDGAGHGSMCAGVIAEEDNLIGLVGYAPKAKIICVKALSNNGTGAMPWIEDAVEYACEIKPDIVSMSLGSPYATERLHELIKQLDDAGICVVCAAGNGGVDEGVLYPAKWQEPFAIAAYDKDDEVAYFSAVGPEVDFAFPGVDITSVYKSEGYATMSGTSFACPACAGVMALIISAHKNEMENDKSIPAYTTMDVYNILKSNTSDPSTKDEYYGWGIVDVSNKTHDSQKIIDRNNEIPVYKRILNWFKKLFR